jgi:hypothetical protein
MRVPLFAESFHGFPGRLSGVGETYRELRQQIRPNRVNVSLA